MSTKMPQKHSLTTAAALAVVVCVCCVWRTTPSAQTTHPSDLQFIRSVRIGVLSLFHPKELLLCAADGSSLAIELNGQNRVVRSDAGAIAIRAADSAIEVQFPLDSAPISGTSLRIHSDSASFWLEVPGKLRRQYSGTLEIRARGQILEAIVGMPLEVAVASVVQAESPPGAGMEALKAQAVAARSFFVAKQSSHRDFDFCDTTHCQFLRSPPAFKSPAAEATRATTGLILTWRDADRELDRPLAAMYARSCGGRTRTLREIGVKSSGYPYYAVGCSYCRRHPEIWQRPIVPDAESDPQTERDRLAFNRIHGWGAIPSLTLAESGSTDSAHDRRPGGLAGRGIGHGIGMCQLGAADMARRGFGFAQILAHYYPNTRLETVSKSTP